jgi:hypothetical protein
VSLRKKIRPMRNALHILLILHLSLTTVCVVARPDACFCGEACTHHLYDYLEPEISASYHNRCLGYGCKTCNIERIMTFDPHILQAAGYSRKISDPEQMSSNVSNDLFSTKPTTIHMDRCYSYTPRDGSPIYLQTHSFLL